MRLETREVLAGAYVHGRDTMYLTHAVEVNEDGAATRVLCSRVKFDSLADRNSQNEFERGTAPTCPVCFRKWSRNRPPSQRI